jgi:hypothetical protein
VAIAETPEDEMVLENLREFPEVIRGNALRLGNNLAKMRGESKPLMETLPDVYDKPLLELIDSFEDEE